MASISNLRRYICNVSIFVYGSGRRHCLCGICVDVRFLGEVGTIFGVICGLSFYRMVIFSNRGSELASISNLRQNNLVTISDHVPNKYLHS